MPILAYSRRAFSGTLVIVSVLYFICFYINIISRFLQPGQALIPVLEIRRSTDACSLSAETDSCRGGKETELCLSVMEERRTLEREGRKQVCGEEVDIMQRLNHGGGLRFVGFKNCLRLCRKKMNISNQKPGVCVQQRQTLNRTKPPMRLITGTVKSHTGVVCSARSDRIK